MKKGAHIVIMAGGSGTRLWPKSRLKKPKQLYALINRDSMIKNTVNRLLPIVAKKNIYIATNAGQVKGISGELPEFSKNIIIEPCIRNTAPCIGLASIKLADQEKPAAFLPADHYIGKEKEFRKVLEKAFEFAKKDYLVLIGIKPTDADTGLGYIESADKISEGVFKAEKFIEKPDLNTAKKFIVSGKHFWNGGMFIAKPRVILNLFKKHAPKIYQKLSEIKKNPWKLAKIYAKMENISFDYAIAEKAGNVAVVPGEFGWSDIGSWARILEILAKKGKENIIIGCEYFGVDTKSCLIHGTERLVATIGLKDIIVIDTPDAVLVCHKDKTQEVKNLVEELKKQGREKYL